MAQSRFRAYRVWVVVSLLVAGMLSGVGSPPASADVTAVTGSAYGYSLNVTIFNQAQPPVGPTPTVGLPAGGSATPVTNTAPTGTASGGPARFFTSGQLDVSTQGTTGPSGSVTSSATVNNINNASGGQLVATSLASTCTASESGATGTTTITGGTFETDSGDDDPTNSLPDHPPAVATLPTNPAVNQTFEGHVHINDTTDNFRIVFNEQIVDPVDGSITVNAAHQYLLGPTATGDLIIGQVVCGVTAGAGGATTTTAAPGGPTTTAPPGTTPTTAPQTPTTVGQTPPTTQAPVTVPQNPVTAQQTNTTAASTNTTAAPASTEVGGGAYGFFVSVGLFGGAPASRGPTPTVTLPSGGSATPVTDSAPSGNAQFGPAIIFTSDKLDVSTEGTPGGTVTSSATANNVNRSGQEQLTAATVSSKCTSSGTEHTGSTTISGGRLVTSTGANADSDADDTVVDLPVNPAPNTPFEGKVEQVGDSFRVVLNEQVKTAGGITVNAVHLFLLGPTAVGELIIGQTRCGTTGGGAGGSGGGGGAGGGGGGAGGGSGLAGTGSQGAVFVALALLLIMAGWTATFWTVGNGRRGQWAIPASWSARVSWPPHRNLR